MKQRKLKNRKSAIREYLINEINGDVYNLGNFKTIRTAVCEINFNGTIILNKTHHEKNNLAHEIESFYIFTRPTTRNMLE